MEEEDEVTKASEEQQSIAEEQQHEKVSEQCDTVSTAGDSVIPEESPTPLTAEDEAAQTSPVVVAEATVEGEEERENESVNVEESEAGNAEHTAGDSVVVEESLVPLTTEDEAQTSPVAEGLEREEERENEEAVEEEKVATDEILKVKNEELVAHGEEIAPATFAMEMEEFSPVTEKIEEGKSEELNGEKADGDDDDEDEEVVVKQEEEEEDDDDDEATAEEEIAAEEMDDLQENGDDLLSPVATMKDEESMGEEATPVADTEMETVKSGGSSSGGKRKRGRNSKAAVKAPPWRKPAGEDVCFICLDGGDLVLCDRRGCPKAYHPSCVDHDEEFFKSKGRWNCGWHLCNICGKNAYFMCYTCTYSLCKGCSKDAAIFCVRGNRGLCESCMKTVMMIENSEQNETGQMAFDDKSSWEYLFKDYWIEQKGKLCITSDELAQAKNPWKVSGGTDKQQTEVHDVDTDSDSSLGNLEVTDSKRKNGKRKPKTLESDTDSSSEKNEDTGKRKSKRKLKSQSKEAYSDSEHSSENQDTSNKRGKRARRLSKSRSKGRNLTKATATVAAHEGISVDGTIEWASKELLEFVMHMKNGDKSVLTQFDVQGLLLEYIKRNKLRDPRRQSQIICDSMLQNLFGKPRVGHFEMLKLLEAHFLLKEDPHTDDNQGSVVDTEIGQLDGDDNTDSFADAGRSRGRKSRKRGEERGNQNRDDYAAIDMHNINLIYLRRSIMEALMEDSETFHDKVVGSFVRIRIVGSNQKQDMYRLVQIIGTSKTAEPYRVGKRTTDVMLEILNLDKTEVIAIDTISNQEFTEDECKRLRQSIKCGLISRMTVGDVLEKARELQEVRVTDWLEAEVVRLSHLRDRASEKGRKKELRECVEKLQLLKTPEERQRRLAEIPEVHADPKMDPSCDSEDESEMDNKRQGNMRPRDGGFFRRGREHFSSRKGGSVSNDSWSANARPPNKRWEPNRDSSGKGFSRRDDTTNSSSVPGEQHTWNNGVDKATPRSNSWDKPRIASNPSTSTRPEYPGTQSVSESGQPQADEKVNESEKMWHYRDPTGKVQGPFSMVQLRKWSITGYFPADLRIWRSSQTEDDAILLTEALAGRFQKDTTPKIRNTPPSIDTSKLSGGRFDSTTNLPSPTPTRSTSVWSGSQTSETKRSTTTTFQGANERLPSPTPTSPSSDPRGVERSNFSRHSKAIGVSENKPENVQVSSVTNPTGQYLSTPVPPVQPAVNVANQGFHTPDNTAMMNQTNVGPANVVQPGVGQNPSVYPQGWAGSGYVARPEMMNANMAPNNPNTVGPTQLAYGQWAGAPVTNQAPSYGAGYPPGPPANFPAVPPQNAWGPGPTNMPWGGQGQQKQQPMNPNMGWAAGPQPGVAYGPTMGQLAPTMPSGNATMGWAGQGTGPPAGGAVNQGWAPASGNAGGNQNRNGGSGQRNRQSSGPGTPRGQRVCVFHENGHCRKGAACDYIHT